MNVRRLALWAAAVCLPGLFAADPALNNVTTVYLLPMSGGLDQYLANRLARSGRFHVVTDPAKADAVFTDRLGTGFEDKMTELYPPPPPPDAPPPAKEEKDKKEEEASIASLMGSAAPISRVGGGFSRGKGNVFLIDRDSRVVLWSDFVRGRSTRPEDMDRVADDLTGKLVGEAKAISKAVQKGTIAPPPPRPVPAVAPPPPPPAPVAEPERPVAPPATTVAPEAPAKPAPPASEKVAPPAPAK